MVQSSKFELIVNVQTARSARACASSSEKFFLLSTAGQIVATFNAIGSKLSQLRVAK